MNEVETVSNKRSRKEYYQNNKEKYSKTYKKYYEKNKEKIKEYHHEYYKKNKERLLQRHKERFQNDVELREKRKEYNRKYYDENKEIILKKAKKSGKFYNERLKLLKQKENQWNELKKWLEDYFKGMTIEEIGVDDFYKKGMFRMNEYTLDKMKEIENGENNE